MYAKYFKDYVPYQSPSPLNRVLPLPPVSETELHGQLLDWASQYLYTKKFPWNLITALLKILKNDLDKLDLSESKVKEEDSSEETKGFAWYNALDAKNLLIEKVDAMCLSFEKDYVPDYIELELKQPFYEINCTSIKNTRRTLEDRFSIVPSMEHIFELPVTSSYFAVFDGHNGSEAANYSAAQLHVNLVGLDSYPENVIQALSEACHTTDDEFLLKCIATNHKSGTTLALALFVDDKLFVAWVGDSQVMVSRESTGLESIVTPHKPGRLDEIERITELGGEVKRYDSSDTWRVNGCLAVSRAIGDPEFKKFVIPTPDVIEVKLDGTEEYVLLATDGLWDDVSPEKCHALIRSHLTFARSQNGLCLALAEEAKRRGSRDNITAIVVFLKPVSELIEKYSTPLPREEKKNSVNNENTVIHQEVEEMGIGETVGSLPTGEGGCTSPESEEGIGSPGSGCAI